MTVLTQGVLRRFVEFWALVITYDSLGVKGLWVPSFLVLLGASSICPRIEGNKRLSWNAWIVFTHNLAALCLGTGKHCGKVYEELCL